MNAKAYRLFAEDTAKSYVSLYDWYYEPVSVHEMMLHRSRVIAALCIPIGQASEEAVEARHKDMRYVRLNHTCNKSGILCNG